MNPRQRILGKTGRDNFTIRRFNMLVLLLDLVLPQLVGLILRRGLFGRDTRLTIVAQKPLKWDVQNVMLIFSI